ncbi:SCO family protein [Streptomyces pathocidini]|uniref:SCO family protein n=1 Tax=Streptomyces pathocidini TaxID=1650571 RepID=A0ABW7UPG1_9ACTN|nr:SCO family protein [Streptomyces pathocidini]
MRKTPVLAAALATAAALALTACGGAGKDSGSGSAVASVPTQRNATVLDRPFAKPELVLKDTKGEEYDLVKETRGHPTLLYFGYTNCPDACPFTMSNIDLALRKLPQAEREKLRVVFVTSDPGQDTPSRLGSWLRQQNPSFTGLTGDFDTIQAGARTLGIYLDKPKKDKSGKWVSTHGTQVLAFLPKDDRAHVLFSKDTTAEEYAEDLPKIIEGRTP